jgi:hypothetical protein
VGEALLHPLTASGQMFKDDVKGFTSTSDICFMEGHNDF